MKRLLILAGRVTLLVGKTALLVWLLTRNLETPVFLYRNF